MWRNRPSLPQQPLRKRSAVCKPVTDWRPFVGCCSQKLVAALLSLLLPPSPKVITRRVPARSGSITPVGAWPRVQVRPRRVAVARPRVLPAPPLPQNGQVSGREQGAPDDAALLTRRVPASKDARPLPYEARASVRLGRNTPLKEARRPRMERALEEAVPLKPRRGARLASACFRALAEARVIHEERTKGPAHALPLRRAPRRDVRHLEPAPRPEAALVVRRPLQVPPQARPRGPSEVRLLRDAIAVRA